MKIIKIKVEQLEIPLKHPYVLSKEYGILENTTPVIVTIYTDESIVGYGECDPWPLFTGDSADISTLVIEKYLAPKLIGKDPTNINEIHRIMDATIRNQHLTKSAIDMAVYDIMGKSCNVPVYKLLGGNRRDYMRCMWSAGGNTPEELADEVLNAKELGYYGCMLKVGTSDYKLDAEKTIAVRKTVGPDFPLIADANQGWDVDTAIKYCDLVSDVGLLFFEQPCQSWDVDGMAYVKNNINIPLSADESVSTLQDAKRLIEKKAVDIFSVKVTKNGGIFPAKQICDLACVNGIKIFFNSMIEEGITEAASLNLGVTCSNIVEGIGHAYFSPFRLDADICSYHTQIKPEEGKTMLSNNSGLGVEIYEDKIEKYLTYRAIIE